MPPSTSCLSSYLLEHSPFLASIFSTWNTAYITDRSVQVLRYIELPCKYTVMHLRIYLLRCRYIVLHFMYTVLHCVYTVLMQVY